MNVLPDGYFNDTRHSVLVLGREFFVCSLGVKCPIKGEPCCQDPLEQIHAPQNPSPGKGYILSGPLPTAYLGPLSLSPLSLLLHTSSWIASGTHLIKGIPEAQQEEHIFLHVLGEWLAEGLAQRGAHGALRAPRGQ